MKEVWRRLRRVSGAISRRRKRLARLIVLVRGALYRPRLSGVTFVAITGSVGKTITKDLAAAVLSAVGPTEKTTGNLNSRVYNARTVLSTRPSARYCVVETAISRRGRLASTLRYIVRPRIGIVTSIGTDHRSALGSPEEIAEEKGRVVESLPRDGVAILNADDPLVLAMRTRCRGRILTYGCSPDADIRGEDLRGAWPEPLSLTACHGAERVRVHTRLHGHHWAAAVLAALAAGVTEGLPLSAAAEAIEEVEPEPGRLSVVTHDDGVVFIRDDYKASIKSIPPTLDFLRSARARRKIAVFGTISDYPGNATRWYVRTARDALSVADIVMFVGPNGSLALRARRGPHDAIKAFATVRDASRYLNGILEPGDLVLLKGSNTADHLVRLAMARTRAIGCWRNRCGRIVSCDECELIEQALPPECDTNDSGRAPVADANHAPDRPAGPGAASAVVVGLGNPGRKYRDTPHNIGHTVVDALATLLGADWSDEEDAMIARAVFKGTPLLLVKLATPINRSGPALQMLSRRLGFGPAECVLVYDDADMPRGRVRVRMRGSSGGHRGVGSILESFQSDGFRRVKIGVSHPDGGKVTADYLLKPFASADQPLIHRASETAVAKILDLIARGGVGVGRET